MRACVRACVRVVGCSFRLGLPDRDRGNRPTLVAYFAILSQPVSSVWCALGKDYADNSIKGGPKRTTMKAPIDSNGT